MSFNFEFDVTVFDVPVFDITLLYQDRDVNEKQKKRREKGIVRKNKE